MRRLFPQSLLGQVLGAVALVLLIAQALSGVLLYRAQEDRREAVALQAIAIQLTVDPADIPEPRTGERGRVGRAGERDEARGPGPAARLFRVSARDRSPRQSGEIRDVQREQALRTQLERQGIEVQELVVVVRDPREDPRVRRLLSRRGALPGQDRWLDGKIVVAGMKPAGSDVWLVARAPQPNAEPRALGTLIAQTLLLYLLLVGLLWFLLRRITRPLAALTQRVEAFGETRGIDGQLAPSGPEDTRRLIAAHNRMEARIAALLDEKDVMLGAIGHDLKTPLAALRVRIEGVTDAASRSKMAQTIADLDATLDDILSLARVGRPSDEPERTDVAALVQSVVEEYEDRGMQVTLAEGPRIVASVRATWLRRALRNLVSNAVRYAGSARVTLVREGDMAILRVEDEGPGIPQAELAAMLEPFRRGEASRNRATGGSGLGLTLARAIAEQHGGKLVLANRKGAGTSGLVAQLHIPID